MRGQKGGLRDRFISYRIIKAKLKKEKNELDLSEFEKLLDFNEIPHKVTVSIDRKPIKNIKENETMVISKSNVMRDKIGITKVVKKELSKEIDFSMFDTLLSEFNEEVPKAKVVKKIPKSERLVFLKNELDYYQEKLDSEYNLMDLEKYENELFRIKNKIDELKGDYSY